MKVLHILSQMPDYTGSGKYVQEMIRQGLARGHEPFLVAGVARDFVLPADLLPAAQCRMIRFDGHDLDFPVPGMSDVMPYPSTVWSTLDDARLQAYGDVFAATLRRAVADFTPDLIHANHLWIASAVAREVAPHLPLVTTCHGTCLRQHHLCPELGRSLLQRLQGIDRVIALFGAQRADMVDRIGLDRSRVHVVSGGFNQECFFDEDREFGPCGSGCVRLLYAGKLCAAKGVPWLLRTLEGLDGPWHLHLVGSGSGPEGEECLRLAAGLEGRVTVHGVLSHDALGRLMRRSDVFVLPSFFEGLPLVLLEALACGCRIVTTALPGVRELFAEAHPDMVRLVELPELATVDRPHSDDERMLRERLGAALRAAIADVTGGVVSDQDFVQRVTAAYGWDSIFGRVEAVYRQAVADRGRP